MAGESEEGSTVEPVRTVAPYLRVVKGDPTAEELAALLSVLASLGGAQTSPARRTPEWNAPRRLHRVHGSHGLGGWRASALPR
jgi:hypothetical protein